MSFNLIRQDLETYLSTNFTRLSIRWPNTRFEQVDEWLDCELFFTDTTQASMGSSALIRTEIQLVLTLFTDINAGTGHAYEMADELALLFDRKQIGTVQCRTTNIAENTIQDSYYSVQLSIIGTSDKINVN